MQIGDIPYLYLLDWRRSMKRIQIIISFFVIFVSILNPAYVTHGASRVTMRERKTMPCEMKGTRTYSEAREKNAQLLYDRIMDEKQNYLIIDIHNPDEYNECMKTLYIIQASWFYYENFKYIFLSNGSTGGSLSINTIDARKTRMRNIYIKNELRKIIRTLKINKHTSKKTAANRIYQYIKYNYDYDYGMKKRKLYDILYDREGVCAAYSELFRGLCEYCGIRTDNIVGNNKGHEWNRIWIENQWYYVDVTWAVTQKTDAYKIKSSNKFYKDGRHKKSYIRKRKVVAPDICIPE